MVILVTKMEHIPICCEVCELHHYNGSIICCGATSVGDDNYINLSERQEWKLHKNCPLVEINKKVC